MNAVFADTFYFLALINEADAAHARALQFEATSRSLVTTAWVLTEVGDALSGPENRPAFLQLLDLLQNSPDARILGPTPELSERGVELFRQRLDKEWSLTDCISFVAMKVKLAGGGALKKKTVVALARRLAIDLWRWRTGRATMQELGWVAA